MAVGISEEHRELRGSVRRLLEREVSGPVVRAALAEGPGAVGTARPLWWKGLAEQGLLGPHLPEESGGGGGGLLDLAVVVEETGRGLLPGGYLPTVLAATLLAHADPADSRLAALAEGGLTAAVAWKGTVSATPGGRLAGRAEVVLGAAEAELLLVRAVAEQGPAWYAVPASAARIVPLAGLDLSRGLARVEFGDEAAGEPAERLPGLAGPDADALAQALARTVLAAEACGIARWALETAVAHARVREQFGRPIGQFQAVKHLCATLLVRAEKAAAATWAAARETTPLTAAVAAALAADAACANAEDCIQILGGIGFTWEHDAHLRLRRALALRQLLGGDGALWRTVATAAARSDQWRPQLELPPEAEEFRAEARAAADSVCGLDPAEQRRRLAPGGWAAPHLPPPYGLGAGPLRQLVVEQELRAGGVRLPDLTIGNWVVPSLAAHGTDAQRERLLMPTLRGELTWCQLFSEPEAGSDLAALRTRAVRQEDGSWRVDGQKVWTSSARTADYGILLARTSPEKPKHKGLTYFVVDMRATPGVEIRPLRELTGDAVFNEVFLDDVRLPADAVVGAVDDGWRVARHTLGNERVHMADSSPTGPAVQRLLRAPGADPVVLGRLVADEQVLTCIDLRTTLSALDGLDPGAGGSVRKLVSAPHAQRVASYALELCGEAGAVYEGLGREVGHALLMSRCLTIAGGTTQVQLNVVAERILGLPRDPQA
ncbi:alkylation response protein AidB-like acyl-CoA dehydrogenase [Streptacidiphilus sp. MAP12-33]|uniref:acyl-CoA dehydrogenase family protein n=1 Tax=Streptacidiphilus sp. MAP12-33 TaxID=3156266 RepID=UPI0035178A85